MQARLTVNDQIIPVFSITSLKKSSFRVGDEFLLGGPEAYGGEIRYQWYKDGVLLVRARSMEYHKQSGTKTELSDARTYKIMASNKLGSTSLTFVVFVAP